MSGQRCPYSLRALAAAFLLAVLAFFFTGGCGSDGDPRARSLLEKATGKTAAAGYLVESGVNEMKSDDGSIPIARVRFESEMDLTHPDGPWSHTVMRQGTNTVEVYSAGGFTYTRKLKGTADEGRWVKTPGKESSPLVPGDLQALSADAEHVRFAGETAGKYTISFDVAKKSLQNSRIFSAGGGESQASSPGAVEGLHMKATYIIARDTMLIMEAAIELRMPDATDTGWTTGTMKLTFKDYGRPVSIIVPAAEER